MLLDSAARGRVLDVHQRRVPVDGLAEGRDVDVAVVGGVLDDVEVGAIDVVLEDALALGAERLGDEDAVTGGTPDAFGEERGLAECRGGVVHRAVGHVEAREFDEHRLVLEEHLEEPLGDFGLVLRVGGDELRALGDIVHERGDVVLVVAAAEELGQVVVGTEEALDVATSLLFRARGDAVVAVEPDRLGDVEQLLDRVGADGVEHRLRLVGVVWRVGTPVPASAAHAVSPERDVRAGRMCTSCECENMILPVPERAVDTHVRVLVGGVSGG